MSGLFSEKTGKAYSATITLENEGADTKGYPQFGMEFEEKGAPKRTKWSN